MQSLYSRLRSLCTNHIRQVGISLYGLASGRGGDAACARRLGAHLGMLGAFAAGGVMRRLPPDQAALPHPARGGLGHEGAQAVGRDRDQKVDIPRTAP